MSHVNPWAPICTMYKTLCCYAPDSQILASPSNHDYIKKNLHTYAHTATYEGSMVAMSANMTCALIMLIDQILTLASQVAILCHYVFYHVFFTCLKISISCEGGVLES